MIDHLVYAVPDLQEGVDEMERRLGVRAAPGGRHPNLGTHNALLSLGADCYLELIAAEPAQPPPNRPRPFGLDTLREPGLVTWAVKAEDIVTRVAAARRAGYDPGSVISMGRDAPDGTRLRWRLTFPDQPRGDGLVPFLIDWGGAPHPAGAAPAGCALASLRAEHPRPDDVLPMLRALEVDLDLAEGPAPALIATLHTPAGEVILS